ncbi:MAG TPA: hypothetical protein VFI03_03180 [Solirubrobacterales bacterium]|nr:hypothetical protein [Solirubrobacterales bacterium]
MKRHRRLFAATAGAALASLALLAPAVQAAPPAAPYQDFAGCPSPTEDEFVATCLKFEFTGGHFELGKRDVPVTNPIVLRGGQKSITGEFAGNSEAGIVPVQQPVPGGLIGLTGYQWLDELLDQPQLKLYATVELAGQPGNLLQEALPLPVKVHLQNPVLGSNCYVGSDANPLMLNLALTKEPDFNPDPARPSVERFTGGSVADSAYAVPGASGCQLELGPFQVPISKAVNSAYGLPAAAGTSEAALDFDLSLVSPAIVYP